ncbi:MAG TPA: GyrI-like domain-containing protein [Aggregatilineales bacterium]|nr:GyrI-like domain-containing protein [Aggregatilineales bacterium]
MVTKLDLKTDYKPLYNPSRKEFTLVQVPPLNFLMIDGQGDPNTAPAYTGAVEALYALAYTLKFSLKKEGVADYPVMPMEGLWWTDPIDSFNPDRRDDWQWTMMIMQPDVVTSKAVEAARKAAQDKKPLPGLAKIRLERYEEGLSVHILFLGAYRDEGPTITEMHQFIQDIGYEPAGKHHEIYLGDPRRSAPEKLKTVIRQPVRPR